MKLALISDSHDNWSDLRTAVAEAWQAGCEVLFFAGDLVRPEGVEVLSTFFGPVHQILGNNEFEIDEIWAAAEESENVIYHGETCDIQRGDLRIFMHHYPKVVQRAAQTGTYDLCIHGHLHTFCDKSVGNTRLLSPGAISDRGSQPEWGIFDTDTDEFTRFVIK